MACFFILTIPWVAIVQIPTVFITALPFLNSHSFIKKKSGFSQLQHAANKKDYKKKLRPQLLFVQFLA